MISSIENKIFRHHYGLGNGGYVYGNRAEEGSPLFESLSEAEQSLVREQAVYNSESFRETNHDRAICLDWNKVTVVFLEEGQRYNLFSIHGENDGYHGSQKRKPIDSRGKVHHIVTL